MSYETRPQTYDETIKVLEKKDFRGIAEFILPVVKSAEEVSLEHTQLSIPDMREMDFLTKVNMGSDSFILHIEFETAYKSNVEMMKRMLRYYTYIKWHNDLPVYQVLVVLYPLRVFMKYDEENEQDHIEECLLVVEDLEDKDYYFLTVECIKKLYKKSKYEKYVKEEILMKSTLYREPYEKGIAEGVKEGKIDIVLKFLTKRFGLLPDEIKKEIRSLDVNSLDIILDKILDYKDLEDFKKFIH